MNQTSYSPQSGLTNCRLCNGSSFSTWFAKDAKSSETLSLGLCRTCGLVQQLALPSDDELKIYYSHHYRQDYKSTYQPQPKHVERAGLAARDRLAFISRSGISGKGLQLLDIGAGGGEFCYLASKQGFKVQGIEPHVGYSEFSRSEYDIQIDTCGIDDLKEAQTDVVTLFHVLEHLAHPSLVMKKIWSVLKPGGHLIVEVPNIHQADASPHNIFFKAHLFYYSKFSLQAAASQYFEVIRTEDQGNLFMAFVRRAAPLPAMRLPSAADVQFTEKRLEQKGWIEYLFAGQGITKLALRLLKKQRERKLRTMGAKAILDTLASRDRDRTGVALGLVCVSAAVVTLEACS